MTRLLAILVVVIALIIGVFAFSQYNKKHDDLKKASADINISSTELFNAFSNNENEANTKYLNKIIEITGVVSKVERSDNSIQIFLETGDPMFGINCDMDTGTSGFDVHAGETVTLRGICSGYLMDVALSRCVLIE